MTGVWGVKVCGSCLFCHFHGDNRQKKDKNHANISFPNTFLYSHITMIPTPLSLRHNYHYTDANSCIFETDIFEDEEEWFPDVCTSCRCNQGRVICETDQCPPLPSNCQGPGVIPPGKCCPICPDDNSITRTRTTSTGLHGDSSHGSSANQTNQFPTVTVQSSPGVKVTDFATDDNEGKEDEGDTGNEDSAEDGDDDDDDSESEESSVTSRGSGRERGDQKPPSGETEREIDTVHVLFNSSSIFPFPTTTTTTTTTQPPPLIHSHPHSFHHPVSPSVPTVVHVYVSFSCVTIVDKLLTKLFA